MGLFGRKKKDESMEWVNAGNSSFKNKDFRLAITYYEKALNINPENFVPWLYIGEVLQNLQNYEGSIVYYDEALSKSPTHEGEFRAWRGKSFALMKLDREEEAIVCCDKALRLNPKSYAAWYDKSGILLILERYEEALTCCDESIRLSPEFIPALEIKYAINCIEDKGNHNIIIMHCITSYPTKPEDANLQMIKTLKKQYPEYPIGFSDHTLGTLISVFSTFYGANCVEKHFTFDNNLKASPDHRLSLNPQDFKTLVEQLRLSSISKGSSERISFDAELEAVKYARRSIVTTQKIPKNTIITENMLDIKRPGTGIAPKFYEKIIGSITSNEIDEDTPIQWIDLVK